MAENNHSVNRLALATVLSTDSLNRTEDLLVAEAHDVHGFHGLVEVVFVLLAGDGEVPVGQETVLVESLQKKIRCGRKNGVKTQSFMRKGQAKRLNYRMFLTIFRLFFHNKIKRTN